MNPSVFTICSLFLHYFWANTVSFFLHNHPPPRPRPQHLARVSLSLLFFCSRLGKAVWSLHQAGRGPFNILIKREITSRLQLFISCQPFLLLLPDFTRGAGRCIKLHNPELVSDESVTIWLIKLEIIKAARLRTHEETIIRVFTQLLFDNTD